MRVVLLVVIVFLTACARHEVTLRHPETGDTVTCTDTTNLGNSAVAAHRVESCVNDYQERGYQRVGG